MTELIEKPNESTTIKHDNPEINKSHVLMDRRIDDETRSSIVAGTLNSERKAIIYDNHVPNSSKLVVSEDHIFPFKPVYDKWEAPNPRKYSFNSVQKWEGMVTEVNEISFLARLVDLTNSEDATEELVEISNEDVSSKDDLELIVPGAIFYWNIGYQTINGQDSKASIIQFRRLPKWSAKKKESIRQKGKKFMEELVWE